eukprot:CAMPEP_0184656430 /NCGR_PEP_ID=MMETSP0308-20130426/16502_1 /TAXON_ID=38269 /ORGANISM="Gloeochaete witrockiana, Strain SAG 46.84" /LENGTH=157 /DNA_ID=CAMNT_0027093563 /DNA_START=152 /DNA_END=625 /DNA_ORIENTATION=-
MSSAFIIGGLPATSKLTSSFAGQRLSEKCSQSKPQSEQVFTVESRYLVRRSFYDNDFFVAPIPEPIAREEFYRASNTWYHNHMADRGGRVSKPITTNIDDAYSEDAYYRSYKYRYDVPMARPERYVDFDRPYSGGMMRYTPRHRHTGSYDRYYAPYW